MRGSEDVPHRITAPEALLEVARLRTPKSGVLGWGPALLARFGYHTPDEWYEAALTSLVREDTDWLDVGCGWRLLPQNQRLAELLAARCRFVAGVDPDPSIERNPLLDEKHRCRLEDLDTDRRYSLISLRMVAEHIANPDAAVAVLGRLATDGGLVVVYTVHKWAPVSLAAAATPMWLHHLAKRFLWGANPSDTFPTVFRLNTRRRLAQIFRGTRISRRELQSSGRLPHIPTLEDMPSHRAEFVARAASGWAALSRGLHPRRLSPGCHARKRTVAGRPINRRRPKPVDPGRQIRAGGSI